MMQAAARAWRDAGKPGSIVNIVANVWRGMPQVAHTCAARAGVIDLSKTLLDGVGAAQDPSELRVPGSISFGRVKRLTSRPSRPRSRTRIRCVP
jgi:NAD(P)-dependent dehydrogenase (short-subunit alcohol dehydrogenase family)